MKSILARRRALLLVWIWLAMIGGASADPVLVLYPEAPDPYRQAFDQIMTGIARTAERPVHRHRIAATTERAQIQDGLDPAEPDATVVILGQPMATLAEIRQSLDPHRRIFVSGINALPGQIPWPGVSLIIEPQRYLQTLHAVAPHIQIVIAFYHAQDQAWVPLATQAAHAIGLHLEPIAVTDAVSAVQRLTETLKTLDPQTTALWFTANTIELDSELLFPWILEQTWARNIVAFSDTITHAKRGFLFALSPDYLEVGAELGRRLHASGTQAKFSLTRAARFALNLRTARHLGLPVPDDLIRRADRLFPQP